ncbi:hypothetical protein AA0474_1137 [Acetobacter lovaniensis NRIC 0474]|nr:hypothetical protein AA0474_1137 [Acetobacter lovaniensis NRIC 0474]
MDILDLSKKVWCWIKWPFYIVAGILIFLIVTQLVECFGADASNKFAGIFTPLIVAAVTIYLSRRQHNIADAQRAVAEESKNIAAANRDIADRKLRLELFDKRYEIYQTFVEFFVYCHDIPLDIREYLKLSKKEEESVFLYEDPKVWNESLERAEKNIGKIQQNLDLFKNKCEISIGKSMFLFKSDNNIVYVSFLNIAKETYEFGFSKKEYLEANLQKFEIDYKNSDPQIQTDISQIEIEKFRLKNKFKNELAIILQSFLHIPEE